MGRRRHDSRTVTTAEPSSFDDAMAFVREHAGDVRLSSGESLVDHAAGTARSCVAQHRSAAVRRRRCSHWRRISGSGAVIGDTSGEEVRALVGDVRKLLRLGSVSSRAAQARMPEAGRDAQAARRAQVEALRKMLLAFAQDIRVVLIRLASRVQIAALLRGDKIDAVAGRGARDARNLRAARQPSRHLATEVGARRPRVPLRRAGHLQAHREAARREAHRARELCDERDRTPADRNWPPRISAPK